MISQQLAEFRTNCPIIMAHAKILFKQRASFGERDRFRVQVIVYFSRDVVI